MGSLPADARPALPPGADRRSLIRAIEAARNAFFSEGRLLPQARSLVRESWRRCADGGVDPDAVPAVLMPDDELRAHRDAHPLAGVMPVIRRLLVDDARDCDMIVAVSDAYGRLLWVEGSTSLRSRAQSMSFVEGSVWSEVSAGTNAPGTALAIDRPVQIFASEHFAQRVTPWSCSAAPIHGPDGGLLGAVDLTGGDDVAAPFVLRLVRATATAAETELRLRAVQESHAAGGRRPLPRTTPTLEVLGRVHGELAAAGRRPVRLRLRHAEILLLLAEHPEGLTADQLDVALNADGHSLVTARAEISRLRQVLADAGGPGIESRPYRLAEALPTDVATVRDRLASGAVGAALATYQGPVLAASDAPGVVRVRRTLADDLRTAVLRSRDPALIRDLARRPEHDDDVALWQACAAAHAPASPERQLAERAVTRLLRTLA